MISKIMIISMHTTFDVQVRLESIEAVNKMLEEANKRIQPNGTGMCWLCFSWLILNTLIPTLVLTSLIKVDFLIFCISR